MAADAVRGTRRSSRDAKRPTVEGSATKKRITYTLVGSFDESVGVGDALEVLRELHDKAIELGSVESFAAEISGGTLDVKDFA